MNASIVPSRRPRFVRALLAVLGLAAALPALPAHAQPEPPERPGATNPLEQFYGPPPYRPLLRDDELIAFGSDASGQERYFGLYKANNSDSLMIERGGVAAGAGGGPVVAAASGRLVGSPLDQVVVVRKINESGGRRLEVLDMYGSDPARPIAAIDFNIAAAGPGDSDSEVAITVTDLDGVFTNAHRHDEIVIARKVIVAGVGACVRLTVWNLANLTQLNYDVPAEPTLVATSVINVTLPTGDSSIQRLGRLNSNETSAIKLRSLEVPINNVMTPCVALAHVSNNATDPRLLLGVFTLDGIVLGHPANEGQLVDTISQYEMLHTVTARRTSGWDIVTGKFTSRQDEDGFDVGTNIAVAVQGGAGDGRVLLRTYYWLYSRLARAACSPDGGCGADDVYLGFPGSPTILAGADVNLSPFPRTFIPGQEFMDGFALYTETTRGPIVQCYVGDTVPTPLMSTRLAWPSTLSGRPTLSGTSITTGTALAGKVIRSRAGIDLTMQNYPIVCIAPDENGNGILDPVFDNIQAVIMRPLTGGSYYTSNEKLYYRHLTSADPLDVDTVSPPRTMDVMVLADTDADSAYYSYTSKTTGLTFYIGPGEQVSFDDVSMPELLIQEPPKHVDFLRTGEFAFSPQVVNVSKAAGFNAGYQSSESSGFGQGSSFKTSSSINDKTGWSIGGSVGLEVGTEAGGAVSGGYENSTTELTSDIESAIGMRTDTVTFENAFRASSDDVIQYADTRFDLWRFPIYGLVADSGTPDSVIPDNPFLQLLLPATNVGVSTQADGTSTRLYQPGHVNGNILSYPAYTTQSMDLPYDDAIDSLRPFIIYEGPNEDEYDRPVWAENEYGVRVVLPEPGITLTYDHLVAGAHDVGYDRSVTDVEGWNVKGTANVKIPLAEGVDMPVGLSGGYEQSTTEESTWNNMTSRTNSSQTTQRVSILTPSALGAIDAERNYFYYPAFYFEKSGAVRLNFHVRLDPGAEFWLTHYSPPDPALNLPQRISSIPSPDDALDECSLNTGSGRGEMKGLVLEDDFGVQRILSPEAGAPPTALSGEVLNLRARVFNLSAGTVPPPPGAPDPVAHNVTVRFDAVEITPTGAEIGPRIVLGSRTIPAIGPRDSAWTADLPWDTLNFGPCGGAGPDRRYRILVTVDPNNTITNETHELFDRDNNPLRSQVTGLPVDFAFDSATSSTRFLERGQNNIGWGDVTVGAWLSGAGCIDTPLSGNVSLGAGALAIASVHGGVTRPFQNDSAVVIRNDALRLRVNISVAAPGTAYGQRTLVVYNGTPLADGSNIVGHAAIADPAGFGPRSVDFDWTGPLPLAGEYTLYARVSDSDGIPGDNQDILTLTVAPGAQETLYVDSNATNGNQSGLTWADAFLSLDDALGVVAKVDTNITIRVAGGSNPASPRVYLPSRLWDPADPRSAAFYLASRVTIEGGYRGTFAPPGQQDNRNPAQYPTVLSGDLLSNDSGFTNRADNAYHVCRADNGVGITLDGLTLRGGNADTLGGAALLAVASQVTLHSVIVADNTGAAAPLAFIGGTATIDDAVIGAVPGLLLPNQVAGDASAALFTGGAVAVITDTVVRENSTSAGRGAITASGLGTSVRIDRARFIGNSASAGAGVATLTQAAATVTNSLFVDNSTQASGAAAASFSGFLTLSGCTITENSSALFGGGLHAEIPFGSVLASGCILWDNDASTPPTAQVSGPVVVVDSIVDGGFPGPGNLSSDPLFTNPALGDFSLQANSPAIDSGDSSNLPADAQTFDLASDPRVLDDTGVPNDPSCGFGPAPIAGRALAFDGVNDGVFVSSPSALNFSTTFTLEAWIRPTDATSLQYIILKGIDPDSGQISIHIFNGRYRFAIIDPPGINSIFESGPIVAGDLNHWVHLAAVRNGQFVNFYRNGEVISIGAIAPQAAFIQGPWSIGRSFPGAGQFNGLIDEVRMWNVARTSTQIQAADDQVLPASTPNLVAYYRFEETGGDAIVDSGATFGQQDATLLGRPTRVGLSTGGCLPVDMGAFEFDGISTGCPSDWNHDGLSNSADVGEFINDWFADQVNGTLVTDFDHNGVVNSTDVGEFINAWFADQAAGGC